MNPELKDMIATTENTEGILGNLFWFSIGTKLINSDDLEELLVQSGIGNAWMPNKIRIADAFRRATREVQRRRPTSKAGIYQNLLIREVASDNEMIQRNIVLETVDQNDKKLDYETKSGIIKLDKKYESLYFETADAEIKEICREVESKYFLYKDNYSSEHLRVLIPKILGSLAPIPMRKNGGIYFVPSTMSHGLTNLVTFINSLEDSESYKVPVVSSKDNEHMVNKKLDDHMSHLLEQCRNTEDLKKGQVKALVEETNKVIEDYKSYKAITEKQSEYFNSKVVTLRNEVINLLNS